MLSSKLCLVLVLLIGVVAAQQQNPLQIAQVLLDRLNSGPPIDPESIIALAQKAAEECSKLLSLEEQCLQYVQQIVNPVLGAKTPAG